MHIPSTKNLLTTLIFEVLPRTADSPSSDQTNSKGMQGQRIRFFMQEV